MTEDEVISILKRGWPHPPLEDGTCDCQQPWCHKVEDWKYVNGTD